jgi:putative phosphoribosyl transferase
MLAKVLTERRIGANVLVVGLPRGGIPVAAEVAKALRAPLDLLIVRKLGLPGDPELALGALASGDIVVENADVLRDVLNSRGTLKSVLERQRIELARREHDYRQGVPPTQVADKTVIVVDDGAATGATMLAAVRALRSRKAGKIVVALPVGSPEAVARLGEEADAVVCLQTPDDFAAVGSWYESFPQVEDDEVTDLIAEVRTYLAPHIDRHA